MGMPAVAEDIVRATEAPRSAPVRKISVLHLIYSPGYGGIETAVINWVKNFDREHFDVHVAYFAGDRDRELPFLRAARAAGIDPMPVPWTRFKPFLRTARAVAEIIRRHKIDILHTHAYYGDAVGALAGTLVPVKTVATVYVWGRYELHRQIMQLMDWLSLQFFDKVTAHCDDTRRKTLLIGRRRRDIPLLLPGYPHLERRPPSPEQRLAMRRAAGIADDDVLLVNAARLAPEKVQDQLLRSFRMIHDRYPKTRLWIKGVGLDWVERQLHALRRELGLESVVKFAGFADDFWSLLFMADMMVHPSRVEGVPLSIMGGLAAGLPIVASNAGGIAEVVHHGHTGLVIPKDDEVGFAEAVMSLLAAPERARAMGRAGRLAVEREHSIDTAVRKVEQVYREVLGDS